MRYVDTISVICFNCDSLLDVLWDSERGILAAEQVALRACSVCDAQGMHRVVLSVDEEYARSMAGHREVPRIHSRVMCDCGACVLDTSYCLVENESIDAMLRGLVGQVKCPNCETVDRQYLEADLPF
jgi:hypothetical protein